MLGDEYFSRVYHDEILSWYAQRDANKMAEMLEKFMFDIRLKYFHVGTKELKQLGSALERFQNKEINTPIIAGKRMKDLYDRNPSIKQLFTKLDNKLAKVRSPLTTKAKRDIPNPLSGTKTKTTRQALWSN